ncbi:hypothetical protein M758_10G035700 [Ceratodon purpureus]|nr:hypothetical protein M758_10G035700 [Ceratodon purpureus]
MATVFQFKYGVATMGVCGTVFPGCPKAKEMINSSQLDVRPLLAVYQRKSQLVQVDKKSESG